MIVAVCLDSLAQLTHGTIRPALEWPYFLYKEDQTGKDKQITGWYLDPATSVSLTLNMPKSQICTI